ncbi:MAG: hypothetical protein AB7G75_11390 [Candidatus Binatia bacterium]
MVFAPPKKYWLFSAPVDLLTFLGSALASFVALWIGAVVGVLHDDTPEWMWIPAILLIDVAHVHATAFRVYFDTDEFWRNPWLYILTPAIGLAIGIALYSEGHLLFWRTLAYLAVFHFVRQQYGWVILYRARAGECDALGQWIDTAAIYAATLYPLIYWHTHLPRNFWWFLTDDFTSLPVIFTPIAQPVYWTIMAAYIGKSLYGYFFGRTGNPGKDIVVITTAICWYVGIISFNSDYAFTVTNVIIHGIPYFVLVYWYSRQRAQQTTTNTTYRLLTRTPLLFLGALWFLAYIEEYMWDRTLWHERSWLFGSAWSITDLSVIIVPLLVLPQVTHYVLDGFIWKREQHPLLNRLVATEELR